MNHRLSQVRGKNFELAICRYLGAKRNHFEAEDLNHPILSIETKHRKKLPVSLTKWMSQAEAAANGKPPVLIIHEERQKYSESLCILRVKDLKGLLR